MRFEDALLDAEEGTNRFGDWGTLPCDERGVEWHQFLG